MKMLCFKEDVKGAVHVILSLSVTLFSDNRTKLKSMFIDQNVTTGRSRLLDSW